MGIGIIGSAIGGIAQIAGARSAARTQSRTAADQIALQREIYDDQTERFAPFLQGGERAYGAYLSELGLGRRPSGYGGFQASPGYRFALGQGMDAVESSAAARGGLNSGATLAALTRYGQGMANQEHGNYLARLMGLASSGQNAAGMQAAAGDRFASGAGTAMANAGNARAAGAIATGNAINSGIGNAIGAWQFMRSQPQQPQ